MTANVAYRAVLDLRRGKVVFLSNLLHIERQARGTHINIDGTLIHTDRCWLRGPTAGVDLWWSGKHHHNGGNVPAVSTR